MKYSEKKIADLRPVLLLVFLLLHTLVIPQTADLILDKKKTDLLVDSLARQLRRYYVDAEAGLKMGQFIKKRCREGHYYGIHDPHQLAGLLSEDVQHVQPDEHFHVEYNPELAKEVSGQVEDVPAMVADKLESEKNRNFGFTRAEVLPGNIGLLEISSFSRLNQYSAIAARNALAFLSNANALIIDLRFGSGGSPDMVTYLLSSFFRERTLVNQIRIPSENATLPYWTEADTSRPYFGNKMVYILTSYKTFSAAEGLAYTLQAFGKALVVGERTRGGAHTVTYRPVSNGFVADIPFGKAICPVNNSNWEGIGVKPDLEVSAEAAPAEAVKHYFSKALASAPESKQKNRLQWHYDLLMHALGSGKEILSAEEIAGSYGAFTVSSDKGHLYYQKAGKARFQMRQPAAGILVPLGNPFFYCELEKDSATGVVTGLITHYEDGRKEQALKSSDKKK